MSFGLFKREQKNLPPGSMGWPYLGEALSYARSPHRFFESRARKYGKVFKTRILGSNVVCFVGPEPFSFFVDNPGFHRDGGAPRHVQELLCRQSLPLVEGQQHMAMRQMVAKAFEPGAISSYLATTEHLLNLYSQRWASLGELTWLDEYKRFSASVCASLLFGAEPEVDNNDGLAQLLDRFMAGLAAFPINLPFTTYGRALGARDQLLSLIDAAIVAHRTRPQDDMLARLLEARDSTGEPMAEDQLRAQMVHLFFAAYGGLFRVLALMSMNLAQYPDVRVRASKEVDSEARTGPLTIESLLKLPYLDAVTREVRRHNRIFASNFFDRAPEGAEYDGFTVPSGWKVTGSIYQTMQDAAVFTDPAKFDPDRFGPGRREGEGRPNAYIPHGGGSPSGHRCPAEDLTTLIMIQAAIVLLRSYQWDLASDQDLSLDNQPSPMPRDGIRVAFREKRAVGS